MYENADYWREDGLESLLVVCSTGFLTSLAPFGRT
jgi:hypothetical protein